MAQQQHVTVFLFTMEGCGHCEALKEGRPSKIQQVESICSTGCQMYKHFHYKDGKMNPLPQTAQEKQAAKQVSGFPSLVICDGTRMEVRPGGDGVSRFIQAFVGDRPNRRSTPFAAGAQNKKKESRRRKSLSSNGNF